MSGPDEWVKRIRTYPGKLGWPMLPKPLLTAIGAVAVKWAGFEMAFDGKITMLARHPVAARLAQKIPSPFNKRSLLFRDMANVAFAATPSLAQKIERHAQKSTEICKKRNEILHGFIFDNTFLDGNHTITLGTKSDGSGDHYIITVNQVEELVKRIDRMTMENILLTTSPSPEAFTSRTHPLTPVELVALQQFHTDFPACPPSAYTNQVRHGPKRKGTPQRPAPFLV